MPVKLSWKPRHFFWLVFGIALGAWFLFRGDPQSPRDLGELGADDPAPSTGAPGSIPEGPLDAEAWYADATAIVGPYPFISAEVLPADGTLVVYLLIDEEARPLVVGGVRVPEGDPAGAIRFTEGRLGHAGVRFQFDMELEVPEGLQTQFHAPDGLGLGEARPGYLYVDIYGPQADGEPSRLMLNELLLRAGLARYDTDLTGWACHQFTLESAGAEAEANARGLFAAD